MQKTDIGNFKSVASARLTAVGDRVIICSYVQLQENQLSTFKPIIALINENNDYELSPQSLTIEDK